MENIQMKTLIFASIAAMSLSVGAAYAQGTPAGFQPPAYGAQAFANQHNVTNQQAGGGAASAKGG
jgi:hypothetical protein